MNRKERWLWMYYEMYKGRDVLRSARNFKKVDLQLMKDYLAEQERNYDECIDFLKKKARIK